jgi:hypothetical protein
MPILKYTRMMRKITCALLAALLAFGLAGPLLAAETTIVLGSANGWAAAARLERLDLQTGLRGARDLRLLPYSYEPDVDTELLLQFDRTPLADASGNFLVEADSPEISATTRRTGAGSLLVDDPADAIRLVPATSRLFQPGVEWGSFTLEFWIYPAVLGEGERIIEWSGREGAALDFRTQQLLVTIRDRKVRFEFENFFLPPSGAPHRVVLDSDQGLIPRRWSHHMVRFDDETALLEYLVDGRVAAVTHVSESGREDGTIFCPRTAQFPAEFISLVPSFTGAIDEVRLIRRAAADPDIPQFNPGGGVFESVVFDLGAPGARVTGISQTSRTPAMTDVFLYYRSANQRASANALPGEWIPVMPGQPFTPVTGRFVQVRAELYPDLRSTESPTLSEIRIVYEPDTPPNPPVGLSVEPGDGVVTLSWAPVLDEDIRGYLVYYGTRPGQYFGSDGANGPSPIDVGRATSIMLSGLENGTLYYFAVSAYDASGVHSTTELSAEVAARPAKVYQ